ncbi:hypothetical protein SOVF_148710 [Spinacia oleracea]|nr:hypothetical protein SOVF_148710 [Spinacia oleracea]
MRSAATYGFRQRLRREGEEEELRQLPLLVEGGSEKLDK